IWRSRAGSSSSGASSWSAATCGSPGWPEAGRRAQPGNLRRMSDYIIGVTGGVAAGKSEVTRRFEALGVRVADADLAARDVVAPGSEGLAELVATFGNGILDGDGGLDRAAMRERVFNDVT